MKNKFFTISVILISIIIYSCSDKEKSNTKVEEQNGKTQNVQSALVKTGEIDLVSIDQNADGKLFECPMDWNVLDDKAGACPVCGMKLKEFSAAEVQNNLTKYGYEYKK